MTISPIHLLRRILLCSGILIASAAVSPAETVCVPATHNASRAELARLGSIGALNVSPQTQEVSSLFVPGILRQGGYLGPCAIYGDRALMGNGSVQTYGQIHADGKPYAIGIEFTEGFLQNLPMNHVGDYATCYDVGGDGTYSMEECPGGHARALFFPREVSEQTPFKWFLLNWNVMGHGPPAIFDKPHFDFHFYIQTYEDRNLIRLGECPGASNCEDHAKAIKPVPAQFVPPGYIDVGAVEAKMGNHLIDPTGPEFQEPGSFKHNFIFGNYDGKITFWEPMITREFLLTKPDTCVAIRQPAAYEVAGYYPGRYCMRYREHRKDYVISLEGFTKRAATPR